MDERADTGGALDPWFRSPRAWLYEHLRVRVLPYSVGRDFGYVYWLPVVIDFGVLRLNRWWWHNLTATFAWAFRLRYGVRPDYWYLERGLRLPDDPDDDPLGREPNSQKEPT